MFSNHGGLVSVKSGALLSVHGNTLNQPNGTFYNTDTIALFGDWQNEGNNFGFSSNGTGIVRLMGGNQRIKGSDITRFWDLRTEGSGIKYGDLNVYVQGYLRLYDRQFNLDTNVVFVFNPALNAVETGLNNAFGFVSSLKNGGLERSIDVAQPYLFPVGGNFNGAGRFRPIQITPEQNGAQAFKVRMAATDATTENYDRTQRELLLCEINPLYYHRLWNTQGNSSATVRYYFETAIDGDFDEIAHWLAPPLPIKWRIHPQSTQGFDATYNLDYLQGDVATNLFNPPAYALGTTIDTFTLTPSANPVCPGTPITWTAPVGFQNYNFYVNNAIVQSGPPNFYTAVFNDGDIVFVSAVTDECIGFSYTDTVEVYQNSVTVSHAPNPACYNETVTATATAGFLNYNFFINGISVQNGASNILTGFPFQNNDIVTVTATDANCDWQSNADTVLIYQNQVILTSSALALCADSSATFTATIGFLNYNFFVNGVSVQNGTSNFYTQSGFNDGDQVFVAATDAHCTYYSDTLGITIYTNIIALVGVPDTTCAGYPFTFTATAGFVNYQFYLNGNSVQNGAGNAYSSSNLSNGNVVYVVGTDAHCPYTSNADTAYIYQNSINVVANQTSICAGEPITFTAAGGFVNYDFSINHISAQTGGSNVFTYNNFANGDTLWVLGTDTHCSYLSNFVVVTVFQNQVSLSASDTIICHDGLVVFTATAGFQTYDFSIDGVSVQNGTGNTFSSNTLSDGNAVVVSAFDGNCTYLSDTIFIEVRSGSVQLILETPEICAGEVASFVATAGFENYEFYVNGVLTQDSSLNSFTSNILQNDDSVYVVAFDGYCDYTSTDTLGITVFDAAVAQAYGDTSMYIGNIQTIGVVTSPNILSYSWTPATALDCAICPVTTANPVETTLYTIFVETADGCSASDTVRIRILPTSPDALIIPNCITPNGDGNNDVWMIDNLSLFANHDIIVVNRWGDQVFRSNNYSNDWGGTYNGGVLPAGTYYYIIKLNNQTEYKGPFTIIRE